MNNSAGFLAQFLPWMTKQVEIDRLKALSPIDSLKKDNLHALVKKTKVRDAQPGEALFREGDAEKRTVYVLAGTVELREGEKTVAKIVGGSDNARNPLSPKLPRQHTAMATSQVEYLAIDSDLLDVMLTWDQTGSYEVSELRGETSGSDGLDDHAAADQGRSTRFRPPISRPFLCACSRSTTVLATSLSSRARKATIST